MYLQVFESRARTVSKTTRRNTGTKRPSVGASEIADRAADPFFMEKSTNVANDFATRKANEEVGHIFSMRPLKKVFAPRGKSTVRILRF